MTNFKPPKPPLFSGAREVSTVQDWLRKVRLYLEKCGVGQAQLVQRAEFFLAGDEGVWYKQYIQGRTDTVEWTVFEDALKDKFYPVNYKIDIVRKFLRAAQKTSVRENITNASLDLYRSWTLPIPTQQS